MKAKASTRMARETMGTLTLMGLGTGMATTVSMLGVVAMATGMVTMVTGRPPRAVIYPLPGSADSRAGGGR